MQKGCYGSNTVFGLQCFSRIHRYPKLLVHKPASRIPVMAASLLGLWGGSEFRSIGRIGASLKCKLAVSAIKLLAIKKELIDVQSKTLLSGAA